MVLTLVPLLVAAALNAPATPSAASSGPDSGHGRHQVIITRPKTQPVAIGTSRSCGASMGPPSPACFQMPSRQQAVALNRVLAARAPRADRDRLLVEGQVVGVAAPGMRALLGLGSSGVALTGRMALRKGSIVRLSVDSVEDPRAGDGVFYDQARVGLINASMPGRYRSY